MTRQPTPGVHENFAADLAAKSTTSHGLRCRIVEVLRDHEEVRHVGKLADALEAALLHAQGEPVAWLRNGENVPVRQVPLGAMWISDKNDPRAFPVFAAPPPPESQVVGSDPYEIGRQIMERIAKVHPWKEQCVADIAQAVASERGAVTLREAQLRYIATQWPESSAGKYASAALKEGSNDD